MENWYTRNKMEKHVGKVIWFNAKNGYGFISWSISGVPQKDLFVHFSDIDCEGFKTLNKEQEVFFSLGSNKHGEPKAINVVVG